MRHHRWLAATVLAHLAVVLVHGIAHAEARVVLSTAAGTFVYAVILAGPIAGLALLRKAWRAGCWVIAGTMAGALVFGVANHFCLAGPDHVSHVTPQWRPLFAATAVLLALTEAAAAGLAVRAAARMR
jgi:diadenosine tetraphosphatase ApaH/serine/threonine PP2A family protein phosphatase